MTHREELGTNRLQSQSSSNLPPNMIMVMIRIMTMTSSKYEDHDHDHDHGGDDENDDENDDDETILKLIKSLSRLCPNIFPVSLLKSISIESRPRLRYIKLLCWMC